MRSWWELQFTWSSAEEQQRRQKRLAAGSTLRDVVRCTPICTRDSRSGNGHYRVCMSRSKSEKFERGDVGGGIHRDVRFGVECGRPSEFVVRGRLGSWLTECRSSRCTEEVEFARETCANHG